MESLNSAYRVVLRNPLSPISLKFEGERHISAKESLETKRPGALSPALAKLSVQAERLHLVANLRYAISTAVLLSCREYLILCEGWLPPAAQIRGRGSSICDNRQIAIFRPHRFQFRSK